MKKWIMIVDVAKCNNCQNCVIAVKDEHVGNEFPGYAAAQPASGHEWITVDRHIRGEASMVDVTYVPRMCNHCDNAPCVAAGRGAVVKREDGIVLIDPEKSKGRRDLVDACPYGAIWWNEERQVPQHWNFDAHLLDAGWKEPRCAQSCPSGALRSQKATDEEAADLVRAEELRTLQSQLGTRPRVYYKGLEPTETCFIGGNACARGASGQLDNIEGALVRLTVKSGGETHTREAVTDGFGDFKIDVLPAQGGTFELELHHGRLGSARQTGKYSASRYLGALELS